ncbi:MAG: amine oxidoreductase, partial [Chloroflexi bacterium]|nr:amine oxidoreductase [Chloroflexota bacterium]
MQHYKYVILGAGPSGLSFAHTLKSLGEDSFLVIEKESVAGGLCRSETVDGAPLDIGGGHFLDVKRQEALNLLFRFLPRSEWRGYCR